MVRSGADTCPNIVAYLIERFPNSDGAPFPNRESSARATPLPLMPSTVMFTIKEYSPMSKQFKTAESLPNLKRATVTRRQGKPVEKHINHVATVSEPDLQSRHFSSASRTQSAENIPTLAGVRIRSKPRRLGDIRRSQGVSPLAWEQTMVLDMIYKALSSRAKNPKR